MSAFFTIIRCYQYSLNVFELESFKNIIIEKIFNAKSNNPKIILFYTYLGKVLYAQNTDPIESFLKEFIEDFFSSLQKYEVYGNSLEYTDKLITQIKIDLTPSFTKSILLQLISKTEILEKEKVKLVAVLARKENEDGLENKAFNNVFSCLMIDCSVTYNYVSCYYKNMILLN